MHEAAWERAYITERALGPFAHRCHAEHLERLGLDLVRGHAGHAIHRLRAGVIDEVRLPTRKSDSRVSYDLTSAGLQEQADQDMKKRRNHEAGFKARGAEADKGGRTVSELAAEYGVHPTMIHQ